MLTDIYLKKIKENEKITLYPDGNGLFLRVSKRKKRWQLSLMQNSKMIHFYGGYYPDTSLANARKWAEETRKLKSENPDLAPKNLLFEYYVDDYRAKLVRDKKSFETIRKFDLLTGKYLKNLFNQDIRKVDVKQIHEILSLIEAEGYFNTARKVLHICKSIFLRAKITAVVEHNPCDGLVKALSSYKEVSRAAIVDIYEFGKLLRDIDGSHSTALVKIALQLSPLLSTRPGELRFAQLSEINFKKAEWIIPAERMKMKDALIVPLSTQAINLFEQAASISKSQYIFSITNNKPYSDFTLRKELQNLGYFGAHMDKKSIPCDAKFHTPHGFRASFRTIADEILEWRVDVIEQQLAHMVRDINGRAYNRTKHLNKRILMMQAWSDFCDVLKTLDEEKIQNKIIELKGLV